MIGISGLMDQGAELWPDSHYSIRELLQSKVENFICFTEYNTQLFGSMETPWIKKPSSSHILISI